MYFWTPLVNSYFISVFDKSINLKKKLIKHPLSCVSIYIYIYIYILSEIWSKGDKTD